MALKRFRTRGGLDRNTTTNSVDTIWARSRSEISRARPSSYRTCQTRSYTTTAQPTPQLIIPTSTQTPPINCKQGPPLSPIQESTQTPLMTLLVVVQARAIRRRTKPWTQKQKRGPRPKQATTKQIGQSIKHMREEDGCCVCIQHF